MYNDFKTFNNNYLLIFSCIQLMMYPWQIIMKKNLLTEQKFIY